MKKQNRNFLKLFVLFAILSWSMIAGSQQLLAQEAETKNVYRFLEEVVGFSEKEIYRLQAGETVVKPLQTDVEHEVAVFGATYIDVPLQQYLAHLDDYRLYVESALAEKGQIFSNPPQPGDLDSLYLDDFDIEALSECEVGDCAIKLPVNFIEMIRQKLNGSEQNYEALANQLFREMLFNYTLAYMQKGNRAMLVYGDKKVPVHMVEEFHELLQQTSLLYTYHPALYEYLEAYPEKKPANIEELFFWAKENIGAKRPVISLNHTVLYRPEEAALADAIIASKQFYASHYFEASLGITGLAVTEKLQKKGFYLLYLNRSRLDVLRHPRFGFIRSKISNGVIDLLERKINRVKEVAEKLANE